MTPPDLPSYHVDTDAEKMAMRLFKKGKSKMELEAYHRSWDSEDHTPALERLLNFIDARAELIFVAIFLGTLIAITWHVLV